jgi:hypothetical protein
VIEKIGPGAVMARWSKKITKKGHALVLEEGVFTFRNPKQIA